METPVQISDRQPDRRQTGRIPDSSKSKAKGPGKIPLAPDQQPGDELPLSPLDLSRHHEQIEKAQRLQEVLSDADVTEWQHGHLLLRMQEQRFWKRDPQYRHLDFFEFAMLVTRFKSRTTLERRVHLALKYSENQYRSWRQKGVCATVLAEIQRGSDAVVARMMEFLHHKETLTYEQMLAARQVVEREVTLSQRTPEQVREEMELALERHRKKQVRRALEQARSSHTGDGGDEDGGSAALLAERAELAERQRVLDEARAQLVQEKQELAQQELALRKLEQQHKQAQAEWQKEHRQALDAEVERTAAQHEQLARARAELAQKQELLRQIEQHGPDLNAELASRWQQVEQAKAEQAAQTAALRAREENLQAQQAQINALLHEAQQAEARLAALDEQARAQTERAAALEARAQELAHKEEQLIAREQAASELHAQAEALMQELSAVRYELDNEKLRVEGAAEKIKEDEERLAETDRVVRDNLYNLVLWRSQEFGWEWGEYPWDLDAAALELHDHLVRIESLCHLIDDFQDTKLQTIERGGPDILVRVDSALKLVTKHVRTTFSAALDNYRHKFPKEVERYNQQSPASTPARTAPVLLPSSAGQPALRFALPTAAVLGTNQADSKVQGVLGLTADKQALLTLCMNEVQSIVVVGEQNSGKSQTAQVLMENALATSGLTVGDPQMAVIVSHYHDDAESNPPPLSAYLRPNVEKEGVRILKGAYRVMPRQMTPRRTLVYVPPMSNEEFADRKQQYPVEVEVRQAKMTLKELGLSGVRLFMAAANNAALYMRKVDEVMQRVKDLSLEGLRQALLLVHFTPQQRDLVEDRLGLLARYVKDGESMGQDLRPGDLVVLDMRSPFLDPAQALTLFSLMMKSFAQAKVTVRDEQGNESGALFKKMMIFDEAHKYMKSKMLLAGEIEKTIRQMRAMQMWVVTLSQDPESIMPGVIKFATVMIVHRLKSVASLKWLSKYYGCWDELTIKDLMGMDPGESWVMGVRCARKEYSMRPQKLYVRPACSQPGGTTAKTVADDGEEVSSL